MLAFLNPKFKTLAVFKILANFKIFAFQNPEFTILADLKFLAF